jgi:hypothetical protein
VSRSVGAGNVPHYRLSLLVALVWILFYHINAWLFHFAEVNKYVNWVFLPAAVRMVSVMVLGCTGVAGLFMGALFTSSFWASANPEHDIATAAISSLGPLLAVIFCVRLIRLNSSFEGMGIGHIFAFAWMGAVVNVLLHSGYFHLVGIQTFSMNTIFPMLVGDLVGTLVVLYGVSLLLRLVSRRRR